MKTQLFYKWRSPVQMSRLQAWSLRTQSFYARLVIETILSGLLYASINRSCPVSYMRPLTETVVSGFLHTSINRNGPVRSGLLHTSIPFHSMQWNGQ